MHKPSTVVPVLNEGLWTKAPTTFLLNLSSRWKRGIRFMPWLLYPGGETSGIHCINLWYIPSIKKGFE